MFMSLICLSTNILLYLSHSSVCVYIYQGNLVLKNFDIRKEAGEISTQAVQKEFNAQVVSENYLEIHLFWAGKGTCCIPLQGTYGPSVSAIRATPGNPDGFFSY